jgi:RecB family exonuclease
MKLTPNRRMAAFLKKKSYGTAGVLPLNDWLRQLYAELTAKEATHPALLSEREEEILWEKIIRDSDVGQHLLNTSAAARLGLEAWHLCQQWQIQLTEIEQLAALQSLSDTQAFLEWVKVYKKICQKNHWVDFWAAIDWLNNAVKLKQLILPAHLELIGFEEFSPQLKSFFKEAEEQGSEIKRVSLVSDRGKSQLLETADQEEELRLAAHQAKNWLQEKPNSSIGIIIPDLQKRRSQVVRILEEVCPENQLNVAAPLSLSDYPIIHAALLALSFLKRKISLEKLSEFLRSPFFGSSETEMNARATLDVALRNYNETEFSLERILFRVEHEISHERSSACPKLLVMLQALLGMRSGSERLDSECPNSDKQSANTWSEHFIQCLEILGWPGERALNAQETAVYQQWQQLLIDYRNLERVLGRHSYSEALLRLTQLAINTPFLPLAKPAPIQVLGLLEAVGIPFDYLWITGMQREAWPLEPTPNPFIPFSIQKTYDLPRSSAARELKVARLFTERFSQGARQIIFSYPKQIDDKSCTYSLLLENKPKITKEALGLGEVQNFLTKAYRATKSLFSTPGCDPVASGSNKNTEKQFSVTQFAETPFNPNRPERAPKLHAKEKITGGTRILKLQAACPFRAFAELRLQAKPFPVIQSGLNRAERGEIIHQVLQGFWEDLPNQAALNLLSSIELTQRIETTIHAVLEKWRKQRPGIFKPQYIHLEKKRLQRLIERFIALEKSRAPFEVIANEQEKNVELAGIPIKMRIDRIDRLANGEEVLIDYKTGGTSIRDWFSERPQEPQLPLYCISHSPEPVGMVFSVLRPDAVQYQGVAKEADLLPGIKTLSKLNIEEQANSWEEQLKKWQMALENLAQRFAEGEAQVDPIEKQNTCRLCTLHLLCRVSSLDI